MTPVGERLTLVAKAEKKWCHWCGKIKSSDQFDASALSRDGLAGACKACLPRKKTSDKRYRSTHQKEIITYNQQYRDTHKAPIKSYNHEYRQLASIERLAYQQQWRSKNPFAVNDWRRRNPQAYRAHDAVRHAIEDGVLIRPDTCERCQRTIRVHAHHEDYSKPLDVRWLCSTCHRATHMEVEGGGGDDGLMTPIEQEMGR